MCYRGRPCRLPPRKPRCQQHSAIRHHARRSQRQLRSRRPARDRRHRGRRARRPAPTRAPHHRGGDEHGRSGFLCTRQHRSETPHRPSHPRLNRALAITGECIVSFAGRGCRTLLPIIARFCAALRHKPPAHGTDWPILRVPGGLPDFVPTLCHLRSADCDSYLLRTESA